MPNRGNVQVFETPQELAEGAAEEFVKLSEEAIREHGRFSVALAGGETPRQTYEAIASPSRQNRIDWSRVHLFFGDERGVPLGHPDGNFILAYHSLISRVPGTLNVYPIAVKDDPARAAQDYEEELRAFFPDMPWPRFDLVWLGLGGDGHTASLFPNTSVLKEQRRWVVAHRILGFLDRITLSAPAINNAANIIFLVTGKKKAEIVAKVLNGPEYPDELPAQLINPKHGSLSWFIDLEAAADLK